MILERMRRILKTLPRWLVVILALVLLLLLASIFWFLRHQNQVMQREVEQELTIIAQQKVDQITSWRADQMGDAELLASLIAPLASRYLADPDPENEKALRTQLESLAAQHDYADILLVDEGGDPQWGLTPTGEFNRDHLSALETALQMGEVVFMDLHRGGEKPKAHISVVAPLLSGLEPFGVLVFISDADQFLYPLIQDWPTPSESAETLLVRQEGDQVLFLNELRHQSGAALDLRLPLSQADLPAVMAVQGVEGFVRGDDYRDVAVAAVLLPVPDSPWFIVSKVDADEAFSEGRFRSVVILILLLGFIGLSAVGSVAVQQRMEKLRYRELHQSQSRQKALLEGIYRNAPLVLMLVDGDRRIRQVNDFAAQFDKRSPKEMLGLRGGEALGCLHALDSPEGCGFSEFCQKCVVRNTVLDTLANRTTHLQVEVTLPYLIDGQERQLSFLLSTTPLDTADEPLALVSMLEITERVQAKQEAQRLLEQQTAINQLSLMLGEQYKAEAIFGTIYSYVQELMDTWAFIVTSYDSQTHCIQMEYIIHREKVIDPAELPAIPLKLPGQGAQSRVIHSGEPFYAPDFKPIDDPTELKHTLAEDGTVRAGFPAADEAGWEELTQSAIYVPMKVQGEIVGVMQVQSNHPDAYTQEDIALLSGIANVAAVAVQSARLIAHLEDAVEERTAELEEKVARLTQSERAMLYLVEDLNQITEDLKVERAKLEASNQELEAFAYSISHDLRAPLRAINGYANFLAQDYADGLDAKGTRFIGVIQESALKMDRLISDLLDLSRVSRTEMKHVTVDMAEMVQAVYQEVASETELADFQIEIQPLPLADCDPFLIERVWKNLIENALKYSSEAAVKQITVGAQKSDVETVYWIRDRGVGFDPRYQQKLFGIFQRLHSEEAYEGTGVGLAIVQRIINRHGGRVWAESETSEGATFFFALPG